MLIIIYNLIKKIIKEKEGIKRKECSFILRIKEKYRED
jgi:hypothetical protein